jgi:hypothetical protein
VDEMELGPRYGRTPAQRFWPKVDKSGDCWVWTASKNDRGYGHFGRGGRTVSAHRVAWELARGPIPEGLWVLHKCDNPPCVNPAHLFLGTPGDNARDREAKGRGNQGGGGPRAGEVNGRAKVTGEIVMEMRRRYAEGENAAALGRLFGITQSAAHQAVSGRSWKHLPMVDA